MRPMPTLLTDEPSNVDELGGAHAKIANTITTVIRTSPGGQTIRLDGTWGAGKSTVIKMVAEYFDNVQPATVDTAVSGPTDVAVFQYDAWVHVGDPLRRAFLSALVGRLVAKGWLEQPEGLASAPFWKNRLDVLSRRLKPTSRKTTLRFSPSAKVTLSALAALGIVAPMMLELEKRLAEFTSAPLFALAVLIGFVAFALIHSLPDEVMGFIIRRTSNEEAVEERNEPEPTSIEFQDAFSELMQAALCHETRSLVIVVDNLDRIDSGDTKAVWALLRSFLDNPQFKPRDWFRRLWVIVPVADEHKALQSPVAGMPATGETQDASPSFLEKVFQLRFNLPPPMLHSWKKYFNDKLIAAFGDDLLGDYDEILRLYEDRGLRAHSNLTPRGIVSFVNELVVLKLEWGDKVALSTLAAYALSKGSLTSDSCSPPKAVSRILHDDSLADTFAMLHHRASTKEEASYISVRPRLEAAMDGADSETIRRLFKESPAFGYVLDTYIRQDIAGLDGQQPRLLQAVRALRPFIVEQDLISPGTASHFRRVALETMAASKNLQLFNVNLAPGLQALLDISVSRDNTTALIVDMLRSIDRSAADQAGALDRQISDGWTTWISVLQGVLSLQSVREAMMVKGFERIILPLGPELWARLCVELRGREQSWILAYCACTGGDDVSLEWLTARFRSEVPGAAEVAVLEQALEDGRENFFDAVAESVVNMHLAPSGVPVIGGNGSLLPTLTVLFRLNRVRLKPYLRTLTESGILYAEYVSSRPKNDWRLATLTCFIIFSTDGVLEVRQSSPSQAVITGLHAVLAVMEGKVGLNSEQAQIHAEVLADLEAFEVLTLIANRWGIKGLTTSSVALALAANRRFLRFVRARGDFDTCLIAFAGTHLFDLTLREQFIAVARQAEATADPNASFDERRSLSELLQETQIPS